jgi:hypothetical protein
MIILADKCLNVYKVLLSSSSMCIQHAQPGINVYTVLAATTALPFAVPTDQCANRLAALKINSA